MIMDVLELSSLSAPVAGVGASPSSPAVSPLPSHSLTSSSLSLTEQKQKFYCCLTANRDCLNEKKKFGYRSFFLMFGLQTVGTNPGLFTAEAEQW